MSQVQQEAIQSREAAPDSQKGGGRKFAALLVLTAAGALALIVGAIWLTETKLTARDTLSRFAPPNAAAYVHADLAAPAAADFAAAQYQFLLPENIRADEVAKLVVYDRDAGQQHVGTLVAWRGRHAPDDAEMRLMTALDAYQLTTGVYLIGDAELAADSLAAYRSGSNLATDPRVVRGLNLMGRLFPIQAYFDPISIPAAALDETELWLKNVEPSFVGLAENRHGLLAMVAPVSLTDRQSAWLGLNPTLSSKPTPAATPRAQVSVVAERNPLNPLTTLFTAVDDGRAELSLAEDDHLAKAKSALVEALGGNIEISLIPAGADAFDYVARFPNLSPTAIKSAMEAYINAALPETVTLQLPDSDYLKEFRYNESNFKFVSRSDETAVEYLELVPGRVRYFVASDGNRGSVLTTNAALLVNGNNQTVNPRSHCASFTGTRLLIGTDILQRLLANHRILTSFFGLNKAITGLELVENDNKLLISCGYIQ